MNSIIVRVEDIPRIIFEKIPGKSEHFERENGIYSEKKLIKGKIIFGKSFDSGCYTLIVLFYPFKKGINYDLLMRTGEIKQSVCDKLCNEQRDAFVVYGDRFTLNVRTSDKPIIKMMIDIVVDILDINKK